MLRKRPNDAVKAEATLTVFACPNEDGPDFNRFGAGNLILQRRVLCRPQHLVESAR